MFRFTIRDVLWLMVMLGMGAAWWAHATRESAKFNALKNEHSRLLALQRLMDMGGLLPLVRGYDIKYDEFLQIIEHSDSLNEFTTGIKARTHFDDGKAWHWHAGQVEELNSIRRTLGLPPYSLDKLVL